MVTGVFTCRSGAPSQKRLKLAARHPVTHPFRRELSIMPEENMPPHFANHSSAFRVQVRSPYPDMRLFLSEGSVHLSRQFLEKLTESAIIKVALREDLSEVVTGSRWLADSPRCR